MASQAKRKERTIERRARGRRKKRLKEGEDFWSSLKRIAYGPLKLKPSELGECTPAQIEDMYKAYLEEEKHDMIKRAWELSSIANVMTRLHAPKSKHTFKPKDFYDPDEQKNADQDSQQAVKKSTRKSYLSLKEKFGSTIE